MRVAIAGSGTLAYWIAYYLSTETNHAFIILSRAPKPHLEARGWQVLTVDYANPDPTDLQFKLAGVDVVVSTVSGNEQLALIDAAARVGVRRFAPAEFEGSPANRPVSNALNGGRQAALARLHQYQSFGMTYTVFSCGILYERFAPGGLGDSDIGRRSGICQEGDFLMNVRTLKAQVPHDPYGQPAMICMTSSQDVGRFVVRAIDLPQWPREFRMRGERMAASDIVGNAEVMRGRGFERADYNAGSLQYALMLAQSAGDVQQQLRVLTLTAAAEGRYDFDNPNLNSLVNFTPTRFRDWLRIAWAGQ